MNESGMERSLVETGDGSHSLYVPALDEQYHSRHGAIQESQHVFIEMGLKAISQKEARLRILEIGFGTGLNALLTLRADLGRKLHYTAIEAFPVQMEEIAALNYVQLLEGGLGKEARWMDWLHRAPWGQTSDLEGAGFSLSKRQELIQDFQLEEQVDLVYFDAFAPNKQPELWTEEIFAKIARMMAPGGMLVTYCAKGVVRRTMQGAGLEVERLPGPPGKREMLRASKPLVQND